MMMEAILSDIAQITVDEAEFINEPSLEIFSTEENKQLLINYLVRELEEVSSNTGREARMEKNRTIMRQRVAEPAQESRDFPWPNASNITPPIALQNINQVTAKMVNAYTGKKPMFQYESDDPMFSKHAEAITRHVQKQVEDPNGAHLYPKLWDIMYDLTSFGTQFLKVPFVTQKMQFNRKSESAGVERVSRVIKASPDIIPLKFEDFLTRPEWQDIQRAPWVAARYYRYDHELRALQAQGFYQNVELVLGDSEQYDEDKIEALSRQGIEANNSTDPTNYVYQIFEVNVYWDADGDGIAEDIIVHIDKASKQILRAEFNELGVRDYVRLPYINVPNTLYGTGIGDIVMDSQTEIETLHNMRIDGQQLAMMPMIITSDATQINKKQGLRPGQIIKTPLPREDIVIHKIPDVSPSVMAAENMTLNQASSATGVSEILSGKDVGGYNRIGASGTQFLAGQSNSYLDALSNQTNHGFNVIPMLILFQNVMNSELVDLTSMSEADQRYLNEVYSMNVEDIPTRFKFRARLAKIEEGKAAKQSEALNLFQVYVSYGDKISQLSAQMSDPNLAQAPAVLESLNTYFVGLTKIMEKVFEGFDEDNAGDYLPYFADKELQLNMLDLQRQQGVDQVEQQAAIGQTAGARGTLSNDDLGGGGPSQVEGQPSGPTEGGAEVPSGQESIGGPAI